MPQIDVSISKKQLDDVKSKLKRLSKKEQDRIFRSALRRAATTARTEVSKRIRDKYTVQAAAAKEDMRLIIKGSNAALEVKGIQHSLNKFKVTPAFKPQEPGVSNRGKPSPRIVIKKGAGGSISGSFWAQMPKHGHLGIFRRVSGNEGLPLKEFTGIATSQMVGTISETTDVQDKVLETLNKRVDHELSRILNQ
jgi:hypothetical protein